MKNLFSFICLLSFSLLLAQDSAKWVAPIKSFSEIENDTIPSFEEPVKWTTSFEKLSDIEYELKFMAKIIPGWYLYSQNLPEGDALPTEFNFEEVNSKIQLLGLTLEEEPIVEYDQVFKMDLSFFKNETYFTQKVKLIDDETGIVSGQIFYQACDEKLCVFRKENFQFILKDGFESSVNLIIDDASEAKSKKLILDLKDKYRLNQNSISKDYGSFINLFLLGFLAGIIALLTPCIFPMIPITVSYFLNQSSSKRQGAFRSFMYGFFIVLIYLLFSLPFHFFEFVDPQILNTLSTNVIVNIIFFGVFIFFAFSFFGFYEITLPVSWVNNSDSSSEITNLTGIFFMALTLAIVSFSCTGPILGSLLVGSLTVDSGATDLTVAIFGFGLALALPFSFLSFFPSVVKNIPRSGGWMTKLKIILGFLELALALKFLSNADLVSNWGILKREIFVGIWLLISIFLAANLFGLYRFPYETNNNKKDYSYKVLGTLFFFFAIYLSQGLFKSTNKLSLLSGFTPPTFYSIYETKGECPLGLNCYKDFYSGLRYAEKLNKPMLIDFTGWACVNCRRMEENVWSKPTVYNILNEEYVLISLYVDDRQKLRDDQMFNFKYFNGKIFSVETIGDKWSAFQILNFKTASQPFYVTISSDMTLLNSPIQYSNANEFEIWLKEGLTNYSSL